MDDLHVDSQLAAAVADDEDADAAAAALEGALQARPQVALLDDGQALLDVARLGHGDDGAVLHVEDAVLLEDGAEHGLHDDRGGRVRDRRRLLVQLLGEEVDAQVAVLARGGRGGDADHLAGAALQDQDVAQADVVAGDGDGVGAHILRGGAGAAARARLADLGELCASVSVVIMMMVVMVMALGVEDAVSHLVHTSSEGVVVAFDGFISVFWASRGVALHREYIDKERFFWGGELTLVVVVTHLGLVVVFLGVVDGLVDDSYVLAVDRRSTGRVDGGVVNSGSRLLVLLEAGSVNCLLDANSLSELGTADGCVDGGAYAGLFLVVGLETGAVFTLGDVDGSVVVTRLGVVLNVGLGVGRLRSRGVPTC